MSEGVSKEAFGTTLKTINGLSEEDFELYKAMFFQYHANTIRKHFSVIDVFKLKQGKLAKLFFEYKALKSMYKLVWVSTRLCCNEEDALVVPKDFHVLTGAILSMDCHVNGVFRIKGSVSESKKCVETLDACVKDNIPCERAQTLLAENFAVLDMTTAFKEIIRRHPATVIPHGLINAMYIISNITDVNEQIIICQMLFMSMPKPNRHLLEATICFLYKIHDIATGNGSDHTKNMTIDGIATIIMPSLVLGLRDDMNIDNVHLLVKFMKIFLGNFRKIAFVDENILKY